MICVGLLILVPSGLCTVVFGGVAVMDMTRPGETGSYARDLIWAVLLFGGPPIALGAASLVWGLRRDRR